MKAKEALELAGLEEKREEKGEKISEQEIKHSSGAEIFEAMPSKWNHIMPSQFKTLIAGFTAGTGATLTLAGIFNQIKVSGIFGFASTFLFNVFIARDINQAREEAEKLQKQVTAESEIAKGAPENPEEKLNTLEKFNLVKPTAYTAITLTLIGSAAAAVKLVPVFLSSEAAKDSQLEDAVALTTFATFGLAASTIGLSAARCIRLRNEAVQREIIKLQKTAKISQPAGEKSESDSLTEEDQSSDKAASLN